MSEPLPDWENFELEAPAGQPVSLPISHGPATGYSWKLSLPAGITQAEDGPPPALASSARAGGAARGALRVSAEKGEHLIEAQLVRPWMPNEPARRVRIRVRAT